MNIITLEKYFYRYHQNAGGRLPFSDYITDVTRSLGTLRVFILLSKAKVLALLVSTDSPFLFGFKCVLKPFLAVRSGEYWPHVTLLYLYFFYKAKASFFHKDNMSDRLPLTDQYFTSMLK